ncbi:MAG: cytochrome c oxidase subunit II [Armatimonadetes bacterium]|nr:cytochrome c oxidase subunit II [Armatimonadota bacterium]MDE2206817.1 cytochrome c oxidase subunit II [Armatimonadota bacterium]
MAPKIDLLLSAILLLTVLFTAGVFICLLVFSIKYRRGSRVDRSRPHNENLILEITWSVIPLILGLCIFGWGADLFAQVRQAPPNAMQVYVIGKQWMWHIQHANGVRENNELHVPLGVPVKLTMISQDVIHDFFVPAFRLHQDVIPGHYTSEWFIPTEIGQFPFFCSQYCGTNHSEMTGVVTVMQPAAFARWLDSGGNTARMPQSMEAAGKQVFDHKLCGSCHGPTDTPQGPSLVAIYGTQRKLNTGQFVMADDAYLRESITDPYAKITAGYQDSMPQYPELTEDQILQLVAYIKSMGGGITQSEANKAIVQAAIVNAKSPGKAGKP